MVGIGRYMVCNQKVSQVKMAGPFSRGDTIINKTFTFTFYKAISNTFKHKPFVSKTINSKIIGCATILTTLNTYLSSLKIKGLIILKEDYMQIHAV
jgi:hypothetical protein